ncbi:hypothetical protein [Nocardioides plantarum]|uniref:Integral membrane protein n=1 Tax=Nocardioides plantarum TaxID=29299 RepID=A0ABV5KED8_9ACTN|nr:hypothetical protein [Nocardioides plantarum]
MSISAMTTLSLVRDTRNPMKSDIGAQPPAGPQAPSDPPGDGGKKPSLPELLAKSLPTEIIVPYTAFIAVLAQLTKPTADDPHPDQLLLYRWLGFAVLVGGTAALSYVSYRKKATAAKQPSQAKDIGSPLVEASALTVSAIAWGLSIPESPLLTKLDGVEGVVSLALVSLVALVINAVLAKTMTTAKSGG